MVSRIHYRRMDQAGHNLLVAVGGWGVLLPPSYRILLYWHTTMPRNYGNHSDLMMRHASAKREPFFLVLPRGKKKADVQSEPNPACWGAVCAGAHWPFSTLSPTPTAALQKHDKKTENSARMDFIEGNNNLLWSPVNRGIKWEVMTCPGCEARER